MPIYQLACAACQKEFEAFASISDRQAKKILCPQCGGRDLKPVYSGKANVCTRKAGESGSHQCGRGCGCCRS